MNQWSALMSLTAGAFRKHRWQASASQGLALRCYHSTPVRQKKFGLSAAFTARGPASGTGAEDVNNLLRQLFEHKMLRIRDARSRRKARASTYTVLNI